VIPFILTALLAAGACHDGSSISRLRVAAIQMESRNGDITGNLARAEGLVRQAADAGALLILLPEFLPSGYIFEDSIWEAAEPPAGETVQWLTELSSDLGIYLGTSFLEACGGHFLNTFVLADPEGEILGRVRKAYPALYEACFFKGVDGPHTIETPIGRIGVAICYETFLADPIAAIHKEGADLLLMPYSAPSAWPLLGPFTEGPPYLEYIAGLPERHARALGIPCVGVNKVGYFSSSVPFIPSLEIGGDFAGFAGIADGDGRLVAASATSTEEEWIIGEVTLDPSRKASAPPPGHGRWAFPVPLWLEAFSGLVEGTCSLSYMLNPDRLESSLVVTPEACDFL